MMKTQLTIIFIVFMLLASACSRGPKPIDFGNELCHFCKMTISDPKFGAELVTKTGKAYKFDAAECMIWFLEKDQEIKEGSDFYVIAFDQPTELISVTESTFMISEEQPSPMGAFLSAYADQTKAKEASERLDGNLYDWKEVKPVVQKN